MTCAGPDCSVNCSVECQKRDWKTGHKIRCQYNSLAATDERALRNPVQSAMSQHFNAYIHLINSEMEPYLNLAYRTDRVDSDWHKENVIQLVFDYDESATDPRKKFHLAQFYASRAAPY
ncbi:hypothetical protein RQP46_005884 [Phenoliferia psychrophenolica]